MVDEASLAEGGDFPDPMLFETVPDAMILADHRGVILLANTRACELFGWPRQALVGSSVEALIPPRFAGAHQVHMHRYSESPGARPMGIDLALYGLRRDGSEFPLEVALSPFKMGAQPVVAASIRDLTHTLRFRDAANRARFGSQVVKLGELALRAKGLDALLEQVPRFLAESLDAEVVILYWTVQGGGLQPRFSHGIPEGLAGDPELAGAMFEEGLAIEADPRPAVTGDHGVESAGDSRVVKALGIASSLRLPLVGNAGLVGAFVAHSRQAGRFGDEELHFMQAVRNVVLEARMRGEVEEQLAHAQRLESIGRLTGGIAHDFNNILTVVLGNLQMLHEALEQEGASTFVKLVESAQRASRRGANLTHKLLTFSRKQSLAPIAIDPAAMLGSVSDMLQRTMGEAIRIEWVVAPGCPACLADPAQLDNAIVNLALNARDAMPAGGRLRMSAAPVAASADAPEIGRELAPGPYVMISVRDSGVGMPPDVLRRAFEPFFTTKSTGKGSGLGLSMVYGFAKQSGGTITIDSEPGTGTEVRLYFPAAATRQGAPLVQAPAQDHAPGFPSSRGTLLVVDDDPEVLKIAESLLVGCGYRVLRATGAEQALRWVNGSGEISLLFTDVVLGAGETGPKLAAAALKVRPELPVLYTSGFAHGSLSVADLRPIQFLAKPYLRDELVARIEKLIAEARQGGGE